MALDPAWVALIGTLCGGVGLKVAEHWLGRNQVKVSDAVQIRNELRMEIQAQREEIKKLEDEAAKWQREYYDLRDEVVQLKIELAKALQSIRDQATSAEILTVDSPPPLDTPKRD